MRFSRMPRSTKDDKGVETMNQNILNDQNIEVGDFTINFPFWGTATINFRIPIENQIAWMTRTSIMVGTPKIYIIQCVPFFMIIFGIIETVRNVAKLLNKQSNDKRRKNWWIQIFAFHNSLFSALEEHVILFSEFLTR